MVWCFAKGEASNHEPQARSRGIAPFEASLRDAPQGEGIFMKLSPQTITQTLSLPGRLSSGSTRGSRQSIRPTLRRRSIGTMDPRNKCGDDKVRYRWLPGK